MFVVTFLIMFDKNVHMTRCIPAFFLLVVYQVLAALAFLYDQGILLQAMIYLNGNLIMHACTIRLDLCCWIVTYVYEVLTAPH